MPLINTTLFPKVARHYGETDGTNAEAMRAISGSEPPTAGAVYRADEQTAGRGQGTNRWHSTPGDNLTFSMVVYPDHLAVDRIFALTQLSGLAVAETVAHFLSPGLAATVRLKWPNDVYVGDQKIAGILVQNGLRGSSVSWSVIGIGLNVNEADFPEELSDKATSLAQLSSTLFSTDEVLNFLLARLAQNYQLSDPRRLKELGHRYQGLLYRHNLPGRYQEVETGTYFFAVLRGVNEIGQLRLELAEGGERMFSLREVRFV
ncbi:biotin--[acetyl-CoA-carboxylase] ligase [Neolewinella persica]|uniref:biotin--[acetyl-CoA-carboxylase] ligase n=1 Tax=Neolewinella persica TaxID=70998 RepID=UPI00036B6AE4|nr:biotin--[acetyl-CoA-carboxylase] ligase [Neolewinella persica]